MFIYLAIHDYTFVATAVMDGNRLIFNSSKLAEIRIAIFVKMVNLDAITIYHVRQTVRIDIREIDIGIGSRHWIAITEFRAERQL